MKKYIIILLVLVMVPFVFSESPPAIPMEVWGQATADGSPVSNGLTVKAMVGGKDYAQASITQDGYYDAILINGDRPLTYNDDPTCQTHDPCITCIPGYGPDHPGNENDYCIEGPQSGETINILIDDQVTIPIVIWNEGGILREDIIVVTGGVINFSITLTPGWNLISIPLLPIDSTIVSIMQGCNYNRVWEFQTDQSWKSTDTGLGMMDVEHGYWVDRVGLSGNCEITISGTMPSSTTIDVNSPWTLVGYPSLTPRLITSLMPGTLYNRIWEFQADQSWKSTDTGLTTMSPGKGYWIDGPTTGSYDVNN